MKKVYAVFGIFSALAMWGIMTALDYIDEYKLGVESRYSSLFVVAAPLMLMAAYFLVSIRDVRPKVSNMLAWLIPFFVTTASVGAVITYLVLNGYYFVSKECLTCMLICFNGYEYLDFYVAMIAFSLIAFLYHFVKWKVANAKSKRP